MDIEVAYTGIRIEMMRRGITQAELAEQLDVHYKTVNGWLNNKADPGLARVVEILLLLGLSMDQILSMPLGELITVSMPDEESAAG